MSHPLTNAEKRDLKARAQRLEPIGKLGHAGMSDAFLKSLDEALTVHGLVKMKFTDFKEERKNVAPAIAEKTGSTLVMQVGNVALFFRAKPAVTWRKRHTPSLPGAGPRSDRFRCGGRESKFAEPGCAPRLRAPGESCFRATPGFPSGTCRCCRDPDAGPRTGTAPRRSRR
jgi:RNA-binding protein